jgi:kynurenine formamidase
VKAGGGIPGAYAHARVIDLAQPLETGMPVSPNHPAFRMALIRRHGDMVRPDGSSASNELIVTGGHVGTHIDSLCHVSYKGELHGGHAAEDAQKGGRFSVHGVETVPVLFCRGILLDVAGAKAVSHLEPAYGVSAEDLQECATRAGVEVRRGDVVLVRTGWSQLWADSSRYLGTEEGAPGVNLEGAEWLADHGVVATGTDTTAYEQILAGTGHALLPVHRLLLFERGIFIMEHLNLEELTEVATEFLFVAAPLKITGATGSPIRPIAVIDGVGPGDSEE